MAEKRGNAEALTPRARVVAGATAGLVAGLLGAFAMDRFQAAVASLSSSDDDGEPATSKAADKGAVLVAGEDVPKRDKPLAGQAVHYALGATLGVAYGIAAELRPGVTLGFGTLFGLGTATVLDEAMVPALGLSSAPWKSSAGTHFYTIASHLLFGVAAEFTRSQVRKTLAPT